MAVDESHDVLADRLRSRVGDSGTASEAIREGASTVGAGHEAELPFPVGDLARLVGSASSRVTDALVADVREAVGSEVAAFEVILSASVGAGLVRWDVASRVIEEAGREAS
ncbi:hypothetical protein LK09_04725 [Microbacterium mangrovi]|uniref:Uncharacterized protein n=1 Tax=Microbacterium mangrovi TaxID=1348253 RepID=A0A0B2A9M9_9MICO|nr:hypothetical protein [Microbacterium mangrovi]KHK98331.1 hypothetical protein LK09_04725 [Microbacterium mangrovi]